MLPIHPTGRLPSAVRLVRGSWSHGLASIAPSASPTPHFFPLFLMPCEPVLRGPFLPDAAFAASSSFFLSSGTRQIRLFPLFQTAHFDHPPASIFALKALSSSSSSTTFFLAFLLWIGFVPAVTGAAISTDVPGGRGPSRAAVRASYLRHLKASCRQAGRGDWLIWARQRGESAR